MTTLLSNCRFVVTQNKSREILENCDILVGGTTIRAMGNKIKAKTPVIDCSQKIVMPAFFNCHTHLAMSLFRGIAEDMELMDWLTKIIFPQEAKLSTKDIKNGVEISCQEMIRFGISGFIDMYLRQDVAYNVISRYGLRGLLTEGTFDSNKTQALARITQLRKKRYPLLQVGIGPQSIYTCSKETLREIQKFCDENELFLNIHIAETRDEVYACKKKTGLYPVQYLAKLGLLGPHTIVSHACWMTKDEIPLLKDCLVTHNPVSNMKLASGSTMPLPEMLAAGIRVGLGTDSAASNNNLDMFTTMRICGLLHKFHRWDTTQPPVQAILDMATFAGPRFLGINSGSIEVGKNADIITLDIGPHLLPIDSKRVLNHVVYSAQGMDVSETIVNGKLLMRGRKILVSSRQ